jgi:hypothetical protein
MTIIIDRAALRLQDTKILMAFAPAILARLRKHDFSSGQEAGGLTKALGLNPELRRKVVEAMLPHFQDPNNDSLLLTRWGFPFVHPQDLDWLLSRLADELAPKEQIKLAHLVSWVFSPDDAKRIDSVVTTAQTHPVLGEVLAHWFKPMILGSEAATKAKRDFEQHQRWAAQAAQRQEQAALDPMPAEHIRRLLGRFESGDMDAWWQMCTWAELEDDGTPGDRFYHIDLHELPGWEKATAETRSRLIIAAHGYLMARDANIHKWFNWHGKVHRPALAGIRALLLLNKEAATLYDGLRENIWQRWLPAVLRLNNYGDTEAFHRLVARCFREAATLATDWTLKVIRAENREGDNLWILTKLPIGTCSELDIALLSLLKKGRLKPEGKSQLLKTLVEKGVAGALNAARGWIPRKLLGQEQQLQQVVFAARLLLKHGILRDWPKIWKLIQLDESFGKRLLEAISYDYHHQPVPLLTTLAPREIGVLWQWMLIKYPMEEDPPERRLGLGGSVTNRWAVADVRDGLISHLSEMGTPSSCTELERLIASNPQLPWLRGFLAQAKEQTRRNTWNPPVPRELFVLAASGGNRLVQDADRLLDVVIDAIKALQRKLHAETPAAEFLWNRDRPKDENALSNWVKVEIEQSLVTKGVIVNREVQIHIGERTDIHVNAIVRRPRNGELDQAKVIIETKGCWHREIKTAMETQLVNRYLKDNDCRHGIYLVGWFLCSSWSKADSRRRSLKFKTVQQLGSHIVKQAQTLSSAERKIRAVALDASLPWVRARKSPKTKPRTLQ